MRSFLEPARAGSSTQTNKNLTRKSLTNSCAEHAAELLVLIHGAVNRRAGAVGPGHGHVLLELVAVGTELFLALSFPLPPLRRLLGIHLPTI
jgi:hypothetical protein